MVLTWKNLVWHAYDTQFSCIYDTHLPHNPKPTHCIAYAHQSPFLHVNTTSFHFVWRTIYTHFHEIGLEMSNLGNPSVRIMPLLQFRQSSFQPSDDTITT